MNDINLLTEKYYSWLKDKTVWKKIKDSDWVEITVPYLDRNNDYIQIYLKKADDGYLLTDDGETIEDLKMEGCRLDTPKRQELLQLTLNGYGVDKKNNELQMKINSKCDFPVRKHSFIQSILAVNDMFHTASSHVSSLFFDDVQKWLEDLGIRYLERVSFKGLSNYDRNFDFAIPRSSKKPERLIKTMNHPVKNSADSIIMNWLDTKQVRQPNSMLYVFINDNKSIFQNRDESGTDSDSRFSIGKVHSALSQYKIKPVLWSKKDQIKDELVA